MSGFAWAALAKASAERAKFEDVRSPLDDQSFSLGGEVSPCLQVSFQRVTFTEVAPEVYFGVYTEEFEREWRDRLLRSALPPKFRDSPPFLLHSANVASLRPRPWSPNSPSDEDVVAVEQWLDRAFAYAAERLPHSMTDLAAAIEANRIGDHPMGFYAGHPVKVRAFVDWTRRTHGVDLGARLLPLLSDRTDPYDLKTMLGLP